MNSISQKALIIFFPDELMMTIARRFGGSNVILLVDTQLKLAQNAAKRLAEAGLNAKPLLFDYRCDRAIEHFFDDIAWHGEISHILINMRLPSEKNASIDKTLNKLRLYASILEHLDARMYGNINVLCVFQNVPYSNPLPKEQEKWLALTPARDLHKLTVLQPENIADTEEASLYAYHAIKARICAISNHFTQKHSRIHALTTSCRFSSAGHTKAASGTSLPLMRLPSSDEVANVAQFLLSEASACITGTEVRVDNGMSAEQHVALFTEKHRQSIVVYLTSSAVGSYRKQGVDYDGLNPLNGLIEELKKDWSKDDVSCLFIAADPESHEQNLAIARDFSERLKHNQLMHKKFDVCDAQTPENVENLDKYSFILLGGGHVPTQNAFFRRINLFEKIRHFSGIVMGISAGSMNCASIVYAQPELSGEAVNPEYERYIEGLDLTDCQVLPHYQSVKDDILDGLHLFNEITLPDSFNHHFIAIPDGSFILQRRGIPVLHGEGYIVADGEIIRVGKIGETLPLDLDV